MKKIKIKEEEKIAIFQKDWYTDNKDCKTEKKTCNFVNRLQYWNKTELLKKKKDSNTKKRLQH